MEDLVTKKIRAFLHQYFDASSLGDDDDIFNMGLVNSLFLMQLITLVEREFHIGVEDDDLEMTNFRSVRAIACFSERKRAQLDPSRAQCQPGV
jgi:methoxymalonate biosynthesis acyl carrier protein